LPDLSQGDEEGGREVTIKIVDNNREIHLPVKTSAIVRVMAEVSAEIEHIASGKVIFHWKGRSVIPEVVKHYRPVKVEDPENA
jgi:hypothetical protein